ncbi:CorA family divalent cation transporter [Phyllobacterium endophyticum]|uniref:Magnesium transporter CorA n=1 Tax=Phyllobacterium endophyticum TaxID=1149773 RepID=A0A2P7AWN7_9HYPH|nr:CorA family divalent cation transporter [Phyllobacterium endophyticum]MBB3235254.1 zinc transporter [Phyllobacterium endophyticum]PSH58624.1 magnesium transporter CorA [Phyllobacterium endophyticum]TYR39310.1 magnesium transporter CorA [Phyllobacterium endophyticum]
MADNITFDPPSNLSLLQSDEFVIAHSFRADGTLLQSGDTEAANSAWVWKSYGLADARARRIIETDLSLPEVVRDALLSPGDQYQITYEDGWLYGELPDLQHKHYGDPRELSYFRFAFNGRLFISGRRHPLQSVDDVRRAIVGGKVKPISPKALFNAIFRRFLDLLKTEITDLSETLDSIEDHIVGENWQGERERLVPVRRQIVVFHRYLTAATGLFRHIDHADRRAFPEELDDLVEGLSRRAETLHSEGEQLQQRARLLQDELLAKLTDQSNRFLYVLSIMTAVLLPSTVISGLFGMNTGGLPLAQSDHGFLLITLLALGTSAIVYFVVRKIGRPRK